MLAEEEGPEGRTGQQKERGKKKMEKLQSGMDQTGIGKA